MPPEPRSGIHYVSPRVGVTSPALGGRCPESEARRYGTGPGTWAHSAASLDESSQLGGSRSDRTAEVQQGGSLKHETRQVGIGSGGFHWSIEGAGDEFGRIRIALGDPFHNPESALGLTPSIRHATSIAPRWMPTCCDTNVSVGTASSLHSLLT